MASTSTFTTNDDINNKSLISLDSEFNIKIDIFQRKSLLSSYIKLWLNYNNDIKLKQYNRIIYNTKINIFKLQKSINKWIDIIKYKKLKLKLYKLSKLQYNKSILLYSFKKIINIFYLIVKDTRNLGIALNQWGYKIQCKYYILWKKNLYIKLRTIKLDNIADNMELYLLKKYTLYKLMRLQYESIKFKINENKAIKFNDYYKKINIFNKFKSYTSWKPRGMAMMEDFTFKLTISIMKIALSEWKNYVIICNDEISDMYLDEKAIRIFYKKSLRKFIITFKSFRLQTLKNKYLYQNAILVSNFKCQQTAFYKLLDFYNKLKLVESIPVKKANYIPTFYDININCYNMSSTGPLANFINSPDDKSGSNYTTAILFCNRKLLANYFVELTSYFANLKYINWLSKASKRFILKRYLYNWKKIDSKSFSNIALKRSIQLILKHHFQIIYKTFLVKNQLKLINNMSTVSLLRKYFNVLKFEMKRELALKRSILVWKRQRLLNALRTFQDFTLFQLFAYKRKLNSTRFNYLRLLKLFYKLKNKYGAVLKSKSSSIENLQTFNLLLLKKKFKLWKDLTASKIDNRKKSNLAFCNEKYKLINASFKKIISFAKYIFALNFSCTNFKRKSDISLLNSYFARLTFSLNIFNNKEAVLKSSFIKFQLVISKSFFDKWLDLTKNIKMEHYLNNKAKYYYRGHNLRNFISTWRSNLKLKKVLKNHFESFEFELYISSLSGFFKHWRLIFYYRKVALRKDMKALDFWAVKLQRFVFSGWKKYIAFRKAKICKFDEMKKLYNRSLVSDAISNLIMTTQSNKEFRLIKLQEIESNKTKTIYKLVFRIAEHWRHWARKRTILRQKGETIVDNIIGKNILSKIKYSEVKYNLNLLEPNFCNGNVDDSSLKLIENWESLEDANKFKPRRPTFIPQSELIVEIVETTAINPSKPITVSGIEKTILNSVESLELKLLQLYTRRDEYLYLKQRCLDVKDFVEYESILTSLQTLKYSFTEEETEISNIKVAILKLAESFPNFAPLIN